MKTNIFFLGSILWVFLLSGVTSRIVEAMDGMRYALIIGNEKYTTFNSLDNPVKDARGMKKALEKVGFYVMYKENLPNKQAMQATIEKFVQNLDYGTVGLFYYAGHGVQVNNKNYLIPTAVNFRSEREVEELALSATDDVLRKMENRKSKLNLIILDACRDSFFSKTRSIWNPQRHFVKKRGLAGMGSMGYEDTATFIVFSTAPNQLALDGGVNEEHSPFTKNFIRGIKTPGLTLKRMLEVVAKKVKEETLYSQIPYHTYVGPSESINFCFSGCRKTRRQPRRQPRTVLPIIINP